MLNNKIFRIVLLIFLLAFAIRVFNLDNKGLGPDENVTLRGMENFDNLYRHLTIGDPNFNVPDINPPLYYYLLRPVFVLVPNISILRLVGALIGALTSILVFFLAKEFFPENAVEYFVSYYDYYQPEAYVPRTDTYIEKDADINEELDKLRSITKDGKSWIAELEAKEKRKTGIKSLKIRYNESV